MAGPKPNPDDLGPGKDFSASRKDKDKIAADALLAPLLPGTSTPVTGPGAAPGVQQAELADGGSFQKTEQGQSEVGDPAGHIVPKQERKQSDAELERIRDAATWREAKVGREALAPVVAPMDSFRAALAEREVIAGLGGDVSPKFSAYAKQLEKVETGLDKATTQLARVERAFETSESDPSGALAELSDALEVLDSEVEKKLDSKGLTRTAKKCREVLDKPDPEVSEQVLGTVSTAFETLEATSKEVATWKTEAFSPMLKELETFVKTSGLRRAASSEKLLEDLNQGQNSYAEGKSKLAVKPAERYVRDDKTEATLDEVYDEALADSPDARRINPQLTTVADLLGKQSEGEKQTAFKPNKDCKASLKEFQDKLASLIVELREEFPDGKRESIKGSAKTGRVRRTGDGGRANPAAQTQS